jgi:outer membrane protein OmpA-like peptidoglycan-associated protein
VAQSRALIARRRGQTVPLVRKGISATRLDEMSSGEKFPIDSGPGEVVWAQNRRAEFVIVSGDMPLAMK